MFRTVPRSIIRSYSLHTAMVCVIQVMSYSLWAESGWKAVPSWSCSQAVSKPVWHITLLCAHWKTPDYGPRNCPKHVGFHSKNKFEQLEHPVGFIIINLSRCMVTGTSNNCLLLWHFTLRANTSARSLESLLNTTRFTVTPCLVHAVDWMSHMLLF